MENSVKTLILKMKEDDVEAFTLIVKRYQNLALGFAYSQMGDFSKAQDIVQEAFIRFYEKNMEFPSVDEAKYWLIRVTKNLAINVVKRKSREKAMVDKIKQVSETPVQNGEDALIDVETKEMIRAAVEKLPEKLKSVLILKEYADLNYKQIGTVLHISESNVKVRVHRARKLIETMLDRGEIHVS